MSTPPASGERRSGRERKLVERYVNLQGLKRKRTDETDDTNDGIEENDRLSDDDDLLGLDEEEEEDDPEQDDDVEEYHAPRAAPKPTKPRTTKRAKSPEDHEPATQTEKPKSRGRPKKSGGDPKPPPKPKAKGKGRPAGDSAPTQSGDVQGLASGINSDNHLFNALLNPSSSFQTVAEDFLDSLRESAMPALAELITMVVRCCGASAEITADEVGDEDGVVGVCEDIMEAIKKTQAPPYPLISKLAVLKPIRKSLAAFFAHLLSSAHSTAQLYQSELVPTLLSWLTTMSSSSLRSFRHTSTYVAACVVGGLCEVGSGLEKELSVVGRQREAERKKRKAAAGTTSAKDPLEKRWGELRERRKKVEDYLKEFFDGVFVHRYRDFDPEIRAECIRELGNWMKAYPAHFLDGQYLRYAGWVLSDANTHVRLEALKALAPLYSLPTSTALPHFTTRFLQRIVQIALSDTDLTVRCAALVVLTEIDAHELWGDDEDAGGQDREKVCLLIWDPEQKVRRAVGAFFAVVWKEKVEEVIESQGRKKKEKEGDREKISAKQLATLLVRLETLIDEGTSQAGEDPHTAYITRQVSARLPASTAAPETRVALAVDALWPHVDAVKEWEYLLELLLLDHTIGDDSTSPRKRKQLARKGPQVENEDNEEQEKVDDRWRLEEREENTLIEVLGASLARTIAEAELAKKADVGEVRADMTRSLIPALPKLFAKYQTEPGRTADLLMIPRLLELDLYVEMRETKAYEQLWGAISQQFLKHSDPVVLRNAVGTLTYLQSSGTSLNNINSRKTTELDDDLFSSLRDAVAGRDDLELANFDEDEVHALGALSTRLACLFATRDLTAGMEDDEGGKQSNVWDILCALAERGRLGYKEEELMIDQCLKVLNLHVVWKTKKLLASDTPEANGEEEHPGKRALREQREVLLEKLTEFAVGTQSNPCEALRRSSFDALLNLYVLFTPDQKPGTKTPGSVLPLTLDDQLQYRCAGFMQAEIEKYADDVADGREQGEGLRQGGDDGGSDVEMSNDEEPKEKAKKSKAVEDSRSVSQPLLEGEYLFCAVISTFIKAIRIGVLHIRHSAVLLAHYGRFGPTVDLCMKALVDVLREEGVRGKNGEAVAVAIAKSLEDSFELYLDSIVSTDEHCLALAKVLSTTFVIRSTHFAILKRMSSVHVVEVHRDCIAWLFTKVRSTANAPNKKKQNRVVGLWKCMVPMLSTVEAREALQIKKQLDAIGKSSNVEVTEGKAWEHLRTYERRLVTLMAKDKSIGEAAKAATRKAAAAKSQREGPSGGQENEEPAPSRPQPRPRPVKKAPDPPVQEEDENDLDPDQGNEAVLLTPKQVNGMSTPLVNGNGGSQQNGKKRTRDEDDDESLNLNLGASDDEEEQRALNDLIESGLGGASQAADTTNPIKRRRR